MKFPKWFSEWFSQNGFKIDRWPGLQKFQHAAIMRITYRAFRAGMRRQKEINQASHDRDNAYLVARLKRIKELIDGGDHHMACAKILADIAARSPDAPVSKLKFTHQCQEMIDPSSRGRLSTGGYIGGLNTIRQCKLKATGKSKSGRHLCTRHLRESE